MQGKISHHATKNQHVLSGEENTIKNDMIKVSQLFKFIPYSEVLWTNNQCYLYCSDLDHFKKLLQDKYSLLESLLDSYHSIQSTLMSHIISAEKESNKDEKIEDIKFAFIELNNEANHFILNSGTTNDWCNSATVIDSSLMKVAKLLNNGITVFDSSEKKII